MNIQSKSFDGITAPTSTVFVVDDDSVVRRAICQIVRGSGLADREFASAHEFLDQYDGEAPGCLVLDIRMPEMSGLELQHELHVKDIRLPIVFLTGYGEVVAVTRAIRGGAVDVIPKPFRAEDLLAKIGEAIEIDSANRRKQAQASEVNNRIARLTHREDEVMRLLANGDSTKSVAQKLSISPKTADNHRAKVLEKMQVDNPTQLAHQLSLVSAESSLHVSSPSSGPH